MRHQASVRILISPLTERLKFFYASREYDDPKDEWDILWTDGLIQVDKLYRMKPYQRINHFPGMYALARKNNLARNL